MSTGFDFGDADADTTYKSALHGDSSNPANSDAMDVDESSFDNGVEEEDDAEFADGTDMERWNNAVPIRVPDRNYNGRATLSEIVNLTPSVRMMRTICYRAKGTPGQVWHEPGAVRKAYVVNLIVGKHLLKDSNFWREICDTREANTGLVLESFLSDAMQWITEQKGDVRKNQHKSVFEKHYELLFFRRDSVTGVRDYANPDGRASDIPGGLRVWIYDVTPYTDDDAANDTENAVGSGSGNDMSALVAVPAPAPIMNIDNDPLLSDDDELSLDGDHMNVDPQPLPVPVAATVPENANNVPKKKGYDPAKKMGAGVRKVLAEGAKVRELMEKRSGNDTMSKRGMMAQRDSNRRNALHEKLDVSLERFACTSPDELRGKVAAYFNGSYMVESDPDQHLISVLSAATAGVDDADIANLRSILLRFKEPREDARGVDEGNFASSSQRSNYFTPLMLLDKESAMAYNTECIAEDQCNLASYIPSNRSDHNLATRFGDFYPSYPESLYGASREGGDDDDDDSVADGIANLALADVLSRRSTDGRQRRSVQWRELATNMFNRFASLLGLNVSDGSLGCYPFPNAVLVASKYVKFAEIQSQIPLPFSLGAIRDPRSVSVRYTDMNLFETLHGLMACSVQSIPFDHVTEGSMPDYIAHRHIYVAATKLVREDIAQSLFRALHTAKENSRQMFGSGLSKSTRPLTKYQFVQRAKKDLEQMLLDRNNIAEREVARYTDVNSIYDTTMGAAHAEIKTTAAMTSLESEAIGDKHWREHQNVTAMDSNGERKRDTAMTFKTLTRAPDMLDNSFSRYADPRVSRAMDKDSDDCVLTDIDMAYHSYYLRLRPEFAAAREKQYNELMMEHEIRYPDPTDRPPLEGTKEYKSQTWKRLLAQVRRVAYEFERNEDTEMIHKESRKHYDTQAEPRITIHHRMDLRPHSNNTVYLISALRWFFGTAVNYRLVILVIMSKEHGKRFFIDHANPKNNLMIAGPRSKGKSWALMAAARLSVTTATVTHRTALSEAAMGDNGGGAELQEEAEMALFGKDDKNGGDGNNITKNILSCGRIDIRRLRKDPDTGRMVREVISSNAQKVLIVCSNQPVEKMMSAPMKDRFIMVSLPDAEAGIGDRPIDRTMPSFLRGEEDSSDIVRVSKHIDFIYLFVEHIFRSGALDDLDVMMDTADVLLGEVVHSIESHPGVRSIGPRKLNFIREFVRVFAIRDALSLIFSSVYTHMYPTRENTGDPDCVYTQRQVDDFHARNVRIPFTVDVFLYLLLRFMVATSDHVASAVTMMDFLWSGNQHDVVMPVFVDVLLGGTGNGDRYRQSIESENRKMDVRVLKKNEAPNRYMYHSSTTEIEYENNARKRNITIDPNYIIVNGNTRDEIYFRIKMLITDDPPSEENLASFFYSFSNEVFESRAVDFRAASGEIVWHGPETYTKRAICRFADVDGKPTLAVLVPYLLQHYNIRLSNDAESGQTENERAFADERSTAIREMIAHRNGLELDTLHEIETSEVGVLENARAYARCHPLETIQTQALVEVLSRNTTNLIGNDLEMTKIVEEMYRNDRGELPWEKMVIQRSVESYTIRGGPDENIQSTVHGCSAKVPLHGIMKVLHIPRDESKGMLNVANYNTAPASVAAYFFDSGSSGFNGTASERDRAARYYGTATNMFMDRDADLIGVQLHSEMLCLPPLPYPSHIRKAVRGNRIFEDPAYPVHRYFFEQYWDMIDLGEDVDLDGMNFEQYMKNPVVTYPEHDIRKMVRDREEILATAMSTKLKATDVNPGLAASLVRANANSVSFDHVRRGAAIESASAGTDNAWTAHLDRLKNRPSRAVAANNVRTSGSGGSIARSSRTVGNLFKHAAVKTPLRRKNRRRAHSSSGQHSTSSTGGMKRPRQTSISLSERLRNALPPRRDAQSQDSVQSALQFANETHNSIPMSAPPHSQTKKKLVLDTGGSK